jgi:hypothetical protein
LVVASACPAQLGHAPPRTRQHAVVRARHSCCCAREIGSTTRGVAAALPRQLHTHKTSWFILQQGSTSLPCRHLSPLPSTPIIPPSKAPALHPTRCTVLCVLQAPVWESPGGHERCRRELDRAGSGISEWDRQAGMQDFIASACHACVFYAGLFTPAERRVVLHLCGGAAHMLCFVCTLWGVLCRRHTRRQPAS